MNWVLYHFAQDFLRAQDALRKSTAVKEVVLDGNNAKRNLATSNHELGKWVPKFLSEAGFTDVEIVKTSDSDPIVIGKR
jgi:hypothetical protein